MSTWDTINEPRYPSFKGIMAAKKKRSRPSRCRPGRRRRLRGPGHGHQPVLDFAGRPPKGEGVKVVDEGDGAEKLVGYLAAQKIV